MSLLLRRLQAAAACSASCRSLHSSAAALATQLVLRKVRSLRWSLHPASSLTPPPQDVPGVGAAGEVVSVSPGYARNCLLPARLGVPATEANRQLAAAAAAEAAAAAAAAAASATRVDAARAEEQRVAAEATAAVRRLTEAPLVVRVLLDKAGAVRTPVTAARLLQEVREKRRVELSAASLALERPLSSLGEHLVPLRFDQRVLKGQSVLTVLVKKKL